MEANVPDLALVQIYRKEAKKEGDSHLFQPLGQLNSVVHGQNALPGGFFEPIAINHDRSKILGNYYFPIVDKSEYFACTWDNILGCNPVESALQTKGVAMTRDGSIVACNVSMPLNISGALFTKNNMSMLNTDRYKRSAQGLFITGMSKDGRYILIKGNFFPESNTNFVLAKIIPGQPDKIEKLYPLLVPEGCDPYGSIISEKNKTVYGWMIKNDKEYSVQWSIEGEEANPSFFVEPEEQGVYKLNGVSLDGNTKFGTFHTIFHHSDKLGTSNFPQAVLWRDSKKLRLQYPTDYEYEKNSFASTITDCGTLAFGSSGEVMKYIYAKETGMFYGNEPPEIEAFVCLAQEAYPKILPLKSFLMDYYGKKSELTDNKEEEAKIHIAMEHLSMWKLLTVSACSLGEGTNLHVTGLGVNSLGKYEAYTATFDMERWI